MQDVIGIIHAVRDNLTNQENRIAELILDKYEDLLDVTINDIAQLSSVSPPTITRFVRKLGYSNFQAFKISLAQSHFVGSRYLKYEAKQVTLPALAENIVTKAQSALSLCASSLDYIQLEKFCRHIIDADRIYAFGSGGGSSMIAEELHTRLFRLTKPVYVSSDHQMQQMLAASAGDKDVIIVFSMSGCNEELVKTIEIARSYKVRVLAVTQKDTAVAQAAFCCLNMDIAEGGDIMRPTSLRYAYLAVIDIVAQYIAFLIDEKAKESLRKIKHVLVAGRDNQRDQFLLGD